MTDYRLIADVRAGSTVPAVTLANPVRRMQGLAAPLAHTGRDAALNYTPTSGLVWWSNHGHTTGITNAAKQDGVAPIAKWYDPAQAPVDAMGDGLRVVNAVAEGIEWPSPNALRVTARDNGSGSGAASFLRIFKPDLPVPGENESIWYRLYFRLEQPWQDLPGAAYDENNHPIELGYGTGGEDVTLHTESTATGWRIGHGMTAHDALGSAGFNFSRWLSPVIARSTTYRYEWQLARLTGLNVNLHCRLSNFNGSLLYSDANFTSRGSPVTNLGSTPTLLLKSVANLGRLCAGLNGLGGTYWHPSELFAYQGCFAASRTGWCGAYNPVLEA